MVHWQHTCGNMQVQSLKSSSFINHTIRIRSSLQLYNMLKKKSGQKYVFDHLIPLSGYKTSVHPRSVGVALWFHTLRGLYMDLRQVSRAQSYAAVAHAELSRAEMSTVSKIPAYTYTRHKPECRDPRGVSAQNWCLPPSLFNAGLY